MDIKIDIIGIMVRKDKTYSYKAGSDSKKSFARMAVSVRDPFGKKNPETGYVDSTLWFCKSFGNTADFCDKYLKDGDAVHFEGYPVKEPATESYPERIVFVITDAGFVPSSRNKGNGEMMTAKAPVVVGAKAPAKAAAAVSENDLW